MSNKHNSKPIEKKYNYETDIVPLHPTGFSLGSNDENNLVVIDFFYESKKNNKHSRIVLGSYVIANSMAKELANMILENSDEKLKHDS